MSNPWNSYMTPQAGFNAMSYGFQSQPVQNQMNASMLPRYDIIQVNGRQGVDAFQMGPNSKVLLLDETAPIVWLVQTDGAGYKTPTPYTITPYQPQAPIDINDLNERLKRLEDAYEQQSNSNSGKQSRRQRNGQSNGQADTSDSTS